MRATLPCAHTEPLGILADFLRWIWYGFDVGSFARHILPEHAYCACEQRECLAKYVTLVEAKGTKCLTNQQFEYSTQQRSTSVYIS
jgi:hypothetical protein